MMQTPDLPAKRADPSRSPWAWVAVWLAHRIGRASCVAGDHARASPIPPQPRSRGYSSLIDRDEHGLDHICDESRHWVSGERGSVGS